MTYEGRRENKNRKARPGSRVPGKTSKYLSQRVGRKTSSKGRYSSFRWNVFDSPYGARGCVGLRERRDQWGFTVNPVQRPFLFFSDQKTSSLPPLGQSCTAILLPFFHPSSLQSPFPFNITDPIPDNYTSVFTSTAMPICPGFKLIYTTTIMTRLFITITQTMTIYYPLLKIYR